MPKTVTAPPLSKHNQKILPVTNAPAPRSPLLKSVWDSLVNLSQPADTNTAAQELPAPAFEVVTHQQAWRGQDHAESSYEGYVAYRTLMGGEGEPHTFEYWAKYLSKLKPTAPDSKCELPKAPTQKNWHPKLRLDQVYGHENRLYGHVDGLCAPLSLTWRNEVESIEPSPTAKPKETVVASAEPLRTSWSPKFLKRLQDDADAEESTDTTSVPEFLDDLARRMGLDGDWRSKTFGEFISRWQAQTAAIRAARHCTIEPACMTRKPEMPVTFDSHVARANWCASLPKQVLNKRFVPTPVLAVEAKKEHEVWCSICVNRVKFKTEDRRLLHYDRKGRYALEAHRCTQAKGDPISHNSVRLALYEAWAGPNTVARHYVEHIRPREIKAECRERRSDFASALGLADVLHTQLTNAIDSFRTDYPRHTVFGQHQADYIESIREEYPPVKASVISVPVAKPLNKPYGLHRGIFSSRPIACTSLPAVVVSEQSTRPITKPVLFVGEVLAPEKSRCKHLLRRTYLFTSTGDKITMCPTCNLGAVHRKEVLQQGVVATATPGGIRLNDARLKALASSLSAAYDRQSLKGGYQLCNDCGNVLVNGADVHRRHCGHYAHIECNWKRKPLDLSKYAYRVPIGWLKGDLDDCAGEDEGIRTGGRVNTIGGVDTDNDGESYDRCSRDARADEMGRERRVGHVINICRYCGIEYEVSEGKAKDSYYCSDGHRQLFSKEVTKLNVLIIERMWLDVLKERTDSKG